MAKVGLYSLLAAVAVIAAVVAGAPDASAATMDCLQSTTGSSSINTCINSRTRAIAVTRLSSRTVTKFGLHTASTGGNIADNNTMDGTATGGLADALMTTGNSVSDAGMSVKSAPLTSQDGTNSITGAMSINTITMLDDLAASVDSLLSTTVDTTQIADHLTGLNSASANTGNGMATGGDSLATMTVINTITEGSVDVEF